MIAPPAILIPAAAQELAGAAIALGAQNMHFEDKGAFTGEISAPMLKAYGVTHVILGPFGAPPHLRRDRRADKQEGQDRLAPSTCCRCCASARPWRSATAADTTEVSLARC